MDFTELWHHVSTFDEPVKTELMNTLKYALISLPVVVAGVEGIKALKPRTDDADRDKSTSESLMTVVGMLVGILIVLFVADRFATYFVPDGDYRVVAHMVLFLVIADQSIGSSVRNLVREWTGREGMENSEESQPNPNPNATNQAVQQHPQMAPRPPPAHQMPMNSNNLQTGGHQPAPPVQQELNTMMSNDIEPMAFSEVGGGSFGGSAF